MCSVSACIECHDGNGNPTVADWSAVVMVCMVSLLNGQLIILIVFKAPQIQTKAADYEDNLIMMAQCFKSLLA